MKINCTSCGFKIDLDEVYDDYEGQIKCFACGRSLNLFTADGKIVSLTPIPQAGEPETVVKKVIVETVTTN